MKKTTMADIAKEMNLSKAIVSKALRNAYGVSEETRHKIISTALKMNYDFSSLVNSEKTSKRYILLLIESASSVDSNFILPVINGIETELYNHNININLSTFQSESVIDFKCISSILDRNCIGIILMGRFSNELATSIVQTKKPVVVVDPPQFIDKADVVTIDNFGGAYKAVKHLYDNGHRNICFVGSPEYSLSFYERYSGYKYAIESLGLTPVALTDCHESFFIPFSREQFRNFLFEKNNTTAFFCANDTIASYIYHIINSFNMKIPQDFSVIAFDNSTIATQLIPPLTSVDGNKREIGKLAINCLLDKNKDFRSFSTVSTASSISEKNSVKNLNKE